MYIIVIVLIPDFISLHRKKSVIRYDEKVGHVEIVWLSEYAQNEI